MNLSDWIERWAAFDAAKPAIRYEGTVFSYGNVADIIARTAGALAELGVVRGDRVAWLGLNNIQNIGLLFACARLGAIFVPLSWRLTPLEHRAMVANFEPSLLIAEPPFANAITATGVVMRCPSLACTGAAVPDWIDWDACVDNALPRTSGDGGNHDPVLICYTSGTTGEPKGAIHTQDGLLWNAINSTHMHDLTSQDRVLTTLPMFHVGGLNIQTTPALHAGATVTLHRRFDPAATLDTLQRERITLTVLVPTQLDMVLAEPGWPTADLSSLRCISTGSTIVPAALVNSIQARGIPDHPGLRLDRDRACVGVPAGCRRQPGRRGWPLRNPKCAWSMPRTTACPQGSLARSCSRAATSWPATGATRWPQARRCRTAGSAPVISVTSPKTGIWSSMTARRT